MRKPTHKPQLLLIRVLDGPRRGVQMEWSLAMVVCPFGSSLHAFKLLPVNHNKIATSLYFAPTKWAANFSDLLRFVLRFRPKEIHEILRLTNPFHGDGQPLFTRYARTVNRGGLG